MAWRPYKQLIAGELSNEVKGRVTGWLEFVGIKERVTLDLVGDFRSDIAGCTIRITNPEPGGDPEYMQGFRKVQRGEVGDMTAGLPPQSYSDYPYIEWYGEENGRIVLELAPEQVEVVSGPAWRPEDMKKHDAESKSASQSRMVGFLAGMGKAVHDMTGKPVTVIGAGVSLDGSSEQDGGDTEQ